MVNTVLTDKTGTLTRNVMEFFKASIGGVAYGAGITEIERANAARRGLLEQLEGAAALSGGGGGGGEGGGGEGGGGGGGGNPYREAYFNFYDARIMEGAWAGQPNPQLATEFFRMLALCHTVIPDGARPLGAGGGEGSGAAADSRCAVPARALSGPGTPRLLYTLAATSPLPL
jgi:magnesium-transporting ATPase (P-type)